MIRCTMDPISQGTVNTHPNPRRHHSNKEGDTVMAVMILIHNSLLNNSISNNCNTVMVVDRYGCLCINSHDMHLAYTLDYQNGSLMCIRSVCSSERRKCPRR